jgi:Predicted ATPase
MRGTLLDSGKHAAFYRGDLPSDLAHLLAPAREGQPKWLNGDYGVMTFAPAPLTVNPGEGSPHIRMDRAAEFLFGDWL